MKKYNIINNSLGWLCFVIALVTYMLTLEPTASFWDCPEFISQGAKLEVGHPPGNPIFILTARFFVTLFGGDMSSAPIAVNTMSAVLSAATILLLFWTITQLIRRLIVRDDAEEISVWQMALIFGGGICGALAYTWSDTFWFSAVEAEVYAFSSFCTALVFWLILKWENRADKPHSDRYLILIAYIIGVSIAVHLLNLLCIPAIVLVIYYKKFSKVNAVGSIVALLVSFVIVALILFGLVPGFVKVAQWFELLFVNDLGFGYNTGVMVYAFIVFAVLIWAMYAANKQTSMGAIKIATFLSVVLSGMLFIGPVWLSLLLVLAFGVYLVMTSNLSVRIVNVGIISLFMIFVGYSSYALLLIRSDANTPINQNAPDNVFALGSYLNREQYGQTPLLRGAVFAEKLVMQEYPEGSGQYYVPVDEYGRPKVQSGESVLRDETGAPYSDPKYTHIKKVKENPAMRDQYVETMSNPNYENLPELNTFLPRVYSTDPRHVEGYKGWSQYTTPDINNIPLEVRAQWAQQGFAPLFELAPYLNSQVEVTTVQGRNGNKIESEMVWKPDFMTNLRYFFNYQFSHMYWRYFMWNFAGRQNDIAGNGEPHLGNWISGIPVIDNARLGDQSLLPNEFGEGNKGHNVFYMLPLLLGIIGLLWQALYIKPGNPQRGIEQFWVVCFLFLMTGVAIVLYLNQTPGQPRERDYAFAGSFYAFCIWIGIGVPAIGMMIRSLIAKVKKVADDKIDSINNTPAGIVSAAVACLIGLAIPLQMVSQTWDDHDRSGRYAARDFGMNYLSSVDENAIIFCNGDNDTFPLWYAQEVEGYRTDVRVVNLSYLTTDWYANQQRIPSYEAAPIPMYATPATYAGDRMSYSLVYPQNNSEVTAKQALEELYRSPEQHEIGVMTSPKVVMHVDSAAVVAHYGLNPTDSFQLENTFPYIGDVRTNVYDFLRSTGKGGMNLGNTLSLDFVANSVEGNFERPVYFASTVPSSYYVGLSPNMYITGMASEVTPFESAPVSPIVEKAYENIIGKFRWGGLDCEDPEDLYLDETVRRMVSSTRSVMLDVIRDLYRSGTAPASQWAKEHAKANGYAEPQTRFDMARVVLNTMLEKLPQEACLIDGDVLLYLAETYYDLYVQTGNEADLDMAEKLLNDNISRYAEVVRYATNLQPSQVSMLSHDIRYVDNLSVVIALLNRIEVLRALEKSPEANAELISQWSERTSADLHPFLTALLYVDGANSEQIAGVLNEYGNTGQQLLQSGLTTLKAHSAAGINQLDLTTKLLSDYGIDSAAWSQLIR